MKVINDSTIQIITKGPDPLLLKRLSLNFLSFLPISSRKKGAEAFFQNPVGTGPFKFVSWTRNDRMVFEAYEGYWDGAPKVKRLIIRPVPEVATRLAELQTGNADIITNIPPFLVRSGEEFTQCNRPIHPEWPGHVPLHQLPCRGASEEQEVRQALNYAIDRKAIIDNILKGSGVPMAVNLTPFHFGYDACSEALPLRPCEGQEAPC